VPLVTAVCLVQYNSQSFSPTGPIPEYISPKTVTNSSLYNLKTISYISSFYYLDVLITLQVFFLTFSVINTLRTGDADLRFYITTVQDG